MLPRSSKVVAALIIALAWLGGPAFPSGANVPPVCNGVDVNDQRATEGADFLVGSLDRDVIALGDGADQYFADGEDDVLCGNLGDDVLGGEAGDDYLDGGADNDILAGFSGADVLRGSAGIDTLKGAIGDDVLRSSSPDDVQDLLYDGFGSDTIIGNAEDVWLRCDDGDPDDHDQFFGLTVPDADC